MRINYIDSLKGITIFLVVMGHIAEKKLDITDSSFNMFYGSFHMPIFMFLSGIFAFKDFNKWNIYESISFLKRKTLRIIIPYISIGLLFSFLFCPNWYDIFIGTNSNYWFLPTLFNCMCTVLLINNIYNHINKKSIFNDFLIHYICYLILLLFYYKGGGKNIPYFLHTIKMLPFFIMGTYFSKYQIIKASFTSSNLLFIIAIMGYVLCYCFHNKLPSNFNFKGLFAIPIIIYLSSKHLNKDLRFLRLIGKYTLEIYIFHWFILVLLPSINHLLDQVPIRNFVILFFVTLFISIPIVLISIAISNIIRKNRISRLICFGEYK